MYNLIEKIKIFFKYHSLQKYKEKIYFFLIRQSMCSRKEIKSASKKQNIAQTKLCLCVYD